MATTIPKDLGAGGKGLPPDQDGSVKKCLFATVDDFTELRTQLIALLAKLDADAGVTDTNYESTLTPAALTLVKGT